MSNNRFLRIIMLLCVFSIVFISCKKEQTSQFSCLTNFEGNDTVYLDMDLENAVIEGIVIPTKKQVENGYFVFEYNVKQSVKPLFYKIFYQNETYKFDDEDSLNYENFYGSWEDVATEFKQVPANGEIKDSFRIVGNPRDEKIYYGKDLTEYDASQEKIMQGVDELKKDAKRYEQIVEKARENNMSVEQQLFLDARWIITNARHKGFVNHRWKRNPRVGVYMFYLVVCTEEGLEQMPDYIKNIGKTNEQGCFVNPISWFESHKNEHIMFFKGSKVLKTRAVITAKQGVFTDETTLRNPNYNLSYVDSLCGTGVDLYKHALFQQHYSVVSHAFNLRNIPVIKDVVADKDYYTRAEYEANKTRFDSSQLIYGYPQSSECPCATVKVRGNGDYITLINPHSEDLQHLKKESTGVKTRVGFTYGKFRGKIKFPVMLNQENIWNGLTYAFWLIYQDNNKWNARRAVDGYIPKGDNSKNPQRTAQTNYSEIDIEIIKVSKYWPKNYYGWGNHVEDATQTDEVMYCCTNWDLANPTPPKFKSGISSIKYKDQIYEMLRWSNLYKALTIRTPIKNDVFKEEYYYYEIDWSPREIVWKIGKTPETMQVVGYMNENCTVIPNNQMLCVITQEYHYSEFWPPVVFEQGLIPYHKTDIEGRVYEIVIE